MWTTIINTNIFHYKGHCFLRYNAMKSVESQPTFRRQYIPPQRQMTSNGLHSVISQKIVLFITTAVTTWKYSIYLFICLWHYSTLLDIGRFFSFLSSTQSVGLLGRGISPSQGRYLHREQHKHRINAHTDMHALSGIRTHDPTSRESEEMPQTARPLWSASNSIILL
jgi:hypothetical protein